MMTQRIQFDDRAVRLADLKRQIAAGAYDTDWRLSLAVDAMLDAMLDDTTVDDAMFDNSGLEGHLECDEPPGRPRQPR